MPVQTIIVNRRQSGQSVVEVLRGALGLEYGVVMRCLTQKKVHLAGQLCRTPGRRVRSGQRLQITIQAAGAKETPRPRRKGRPTAAPRAVRERAARERSPLAQSIKVRHMDAHIMVVDKPAGLTTVRHAEETKEHGRRAKFLPPSLVDLLFDVLPEGMRSVRPRAVHRLDKETSGLVVLALTPKAESDLGRQFRAHTIERGYLALVRGHAVAERIESCLVEDRGDGRRGSGPPEEGQRAVTTIEIVERLGGFTLVKCRLETGRTHQVRIHLGERGTPLCGERVYDRPLHGKPAPDESGALRPLLHATSLGLVHPESGERMSWHAKLPKDMDAVLRKLRWKRR